MKRLCGCLGSDLLGRYRRVCRILISRWVICRCVLGSGLLLYRCLVNCCKLMDVSVGWGLICCTGALHVLRWDFEFFRGMAVGSKNCCCSKNLLLLLIGSWKYLTKSVKTSGGRCCTVAQTFGWDKLCLYGRVFVGELRVIALETSAGRVLASSHEGDREKMLKNVRSTFSAFFFDRPSENETERGWHEFPVR